MIEKDDLSTIWSEQANSGEIVVVKKDWIMFHISDIAIFLIKEWKEYFCVTF